MHHRVDEPGGQAGHGPSSSRRRPLLQRALLRALAAPRLPHEPPVECLPLRDARLHPLRLQGVRGQTLAAWLVVPDAPVPALGWPAVLALHGWGANASTLWPLVDPLRTAGFATLLLDAGSHGDSDVEEFASLPRFAEDIDAGLAALRARPGIDGDRIAVLGHSVGAAAALLHASRTAGATSSGGAVRGVVSLCAFAHPQEVMQRWLAERRIPRWPIGTLLLEQVQQVIGERFDRIAPIRTIGAVECPVLLVHGRDDRTVPVSDALRLQGARPGAELAIVEGDHDLRPALGPHATRIVSFLERALGSAARPDVPRSSEPAPSPSVLRRSARPAGRGG